MGIKIGNEPADYYGSVGNLLHMINKNRVGAVFISRLEQHKKLVSIYPMDAGMAARIGADNANTHAREAEDSAPKGASNRQQPYWYRGNPDNPATRREDERDDMVPPGLVGTGKGSDVVINFSPEKIKAKKVFDRSPDTVLFHELVHTLRMFYGLLNPVPTEKMKWMNEEEWLAVILTNIYMSAAGSTRLRGGYGDYDQKLEAPENTSSGFLTSENTKLLDKLWPFWGPVFTDVGFVIVAPFNPIREYLRLRM
jgi:Effector protein